MKKPDFEAKVTALKAALNEQLPAEDGIAFVILLQTTDKEAGDTYGDAIHNVVASQVVRFVADTMTTVSKIIGRNN